MTLSDLLYLFLLFLWGFCYSQILEAFQAIFTSFVRCCGWSCSLHCSFPHCFRVSNSVFNMKNQQYSTVKWHFSRSFHLDVFLKPDFSKKFRLASRLQQKNRRTIGISKISKISIIEQELPGRSELDFGPLGWFGFGRSYSLSARQRRGELDMETLELWPCCDAYTVDMSVDFGIWDWSWY